MNEFEGGRGSLPTTGVFHVSKPVAPVPAPVKPEEVATPMTPGHVQVSPEKMSPMRNEGRSSLSVSPMRDGRDEMEWAANALEALRRANEELSGTLEEATEAIGILRGQNEHERAANARLTAEMELLRTERDTLRTALHQEQTLRKTNLNDLRNAEADITEARAKLASRPSPPPTHPYTLQEQQLLEAAESQITACNYLLDNPFDFDMRD
eukprot:TRINITY_DN13983_c0_g2_i1.p1 TRINITY_DN13983_c0_g2~~TRINITY_DN13983_c0_g2_i1.p1  ORF type:complete len:210 (+),score=55.71 TRINITY_DN13983_c0_g2_i1:31-660(+)